MDSKLNFGRGTTCFKYLTFIEEYKEHYIYHHKSHSEYINRFDGRSTCESRYIVALKTDVDNTEITSHRAFLDAKEIKARVSKDSLDKVKSVIDNWGKED